MRVEIRDERPPVVPERWDKINECSLKINSGKIVVMGCTDYYEDAAKIVINPGMYRTRINYGRLDTLSEDGLDGEDHYEVVFWLDTEERQIERIK